MISHRGISMLLKGTQHVLIYPLVNEQQTMENHHFEWLHQRTKWSFEWLHLPEGSGNEVDILPIYGYITKI
jgi:hypothetical protein